MKSTLKGMQMIENLRLIGTKIEREATPMTIQDDRSEAQKITHYYLVVGIDRMLSGWGKAKDGVSYAAWACTAIDLPHVIKWVRSRRDLVHVHTVCGDYAPVGSGHCHIYPVHPRHPAVSSCQSQSVGTRY